MTIAIAGGGIAGLTLGLTLHQIGIPFRIFEAVSQIRPLGVGINLQPNAVRELYDLGLEPALAQIGVRTRDYGFYTKTGHEIWTEARGTWAGYAWPQYSIHRGTLQMLLLETLVARAGPDCIVTDARVTGFINDADRVHVAIDHDGTTRTESCAALIAADGIHSAVRGQILPHEGPPIWGGRILWRGTTLARPFLSGASMIMAGHDTQRIVAYPISQTDPRTGLATINWIAELTFDPDQRWRKEDWNRKADLADFLPKFEDWRFDWLDVPALIRGAETVLEYPMVDRDPVDCWTQGRTTLIGDAAHPTYPVGSNGASQAIMDARLVGRQLLDHGITGQALQAFETLVRPAMAKVITANRGKGPDAIMQIIEDRCGGSFERIEDVISYEALKAHADSYKALAGFDIDALNRRPPLLPSDPQGQRA